MAAKSSYLQNKFLSHVLGLGAYTPPSTLYVALFTSTTSDAGSGTEVSGGGYVRHIITFTLSGNVATQGATIEWSAATANWGTITDVALYDASTGGNMLYHGPLTASKTINNGDVFRLSAGAYTLTEN